MIQCVRKAATGMAASMIFRPVITLLIGHFYFNYWTLGLQMKINSVVYCKERKNFFFLYFAMDNGFAWCRNQRQLFLSSTNVIHYPLNKPFYVSIEIPCIIQCVCLTLLLDTPPFLLFSGYFTVLVLTRTSKNGRIQQRRGIPCCFDNVVL